jgi:hypothetical protein
VFPCFQIPHRNTAGGIDLSDGELFIEKNVTLVGRDSRLDAKANQSDASPDNRRVMSVWGRVRVTLQSLVITGGFVNNLQGTATGGGIRNHLGDLTIIGCEITNNTAVYAAFFGGGGGGLYVGGGTATVIGTDFSGNRERLLAAEPLAFMVPP